MHLANGGVISRQSVVPCAMTRMVIDRVELLATRQGYKTLKFFNRKKNELMLSNADLLKGVDGNVFVNEEDIGVELPLEDYAKWEYVPAPEEEEELPGLKKSISPN